ncbi:mannose-1-phosphate guanylyltransferase/mannose-6-phosphate isomerase [Sphingobium lactosutens]|nr:mannose-1-phosphate guanylyltransferase/mannose-6-phosphate isomerase [Sphingobium lactosutens]NWK95296.1 mannose-1-phosphate guanylyltransferase/mannose-6-phosphate isomerase [Sphingobium lactosutens]
MSGGSGTRLWPLSRPECPKQFIPLVTDRSMMQETLLRTLGVKNFEPALVVSNAGHGELVREQVAALDHVPAAVILEPMGRNTAPAIALAACWIAARDRDALMLVMPSDHVIADVPAFHAAIAAAVPAARDGRLVTFGIQPHYPETGYGYIAKGGPIDADGAVHAVAQFVEKPPRAQAEAYLAGGSHYWNGGIFLFSAGALLDQMERHAPEVAAAAARAMAEAREEDGFILPDSAAFGASPDVSIDVGVMEKTDRAAVVPVDMGWSDVGSWDALWSIRERDGDGNTTKGGSVSVDGAGNLIYVDGGPPVATIGLRDSVVVSTAKGVLVMPRDRSQDVKAVAEKMKAGALG